MQSWRVDQDGSGLPERERERERERESEYTETQHPNPLSHFCTMYSFPESERFMGSVVTQRTKPHSVLRQPTSARMQPIATHLHKGTGIRLNLTYMYTHKVPS